MGDRIALQTSSANDSERSRSPGQGTEQGRSTRYGLHGGVFEQCQEGVSGQG